MKMKNIVVDKTKIRDMLAEFLASIGSDEFRLEMDENTFTVRPIGESSVLDILGANASDLGPEDLSENVDHYLYRLPKKK